MALSVNIIGRDSEGNLRALKVNSEGNLEISDSLGWGELLQYISNKLDTLADNSGKLDTLINNSGKLDTLTDKLDSLADKLDSLAGKLDSLIDILTSVSNTEEGFVRVNIQEPDTQEP
jgi:ABC-type transporter Mla subunit MlaD